MPKESEKMLVKYRITSTRRIKKELLKFLSVNSIVIPAASTGRDNSKSTAVINTAHTNKGNKPIRNPGDLIFITVAIKFIAPKIEEIPAMCRLNIARSTYLRDSATSLDFNFTLSQK